MGLTAAIVTGTTFLGSRSPGHEIEQVYYLGSIDPLEQLPPTIYRLTVRGQSSGISSVKFASGWAPAALIDSLSSWARFSEDAAHPTLTMTGTNSVNIASERRFVMFGPEGFRPAPKDHRLVMVMGSNPDRFFQAIDEVLGSMAKVDVAKSDDALRARLLNELAETRAETLMLRGLEEDVSALEGGVE